MDEMGTVGLPFIAMHVADPPEDIWNIPDKFMVHQQDAEQVIRQHPETTFILASGLNLKAKNARKQCLNCYSDNFV